MPNMMTFLLEQTSSNSCNLASSRGYMFRSLGPLGVKIPEHKLGVTIIMLR